MSLSDRRPLFNPFDSNRAGIHRLPQSRRVSHDATHHIDPVSRHGIGPHAHRRTPEENGQHLAGTPEGYVTDFDLRGRRFAVVLHTGNLKIELFAPDIQWSFSGQRPVELFSRSRAF